MLRICSTQARTHTRRRRRSLRRCSSNALATPLERAARPRGPRTTSDDRQDRSYGRPSLRWNERHDKYPSRTVNTPHKSKYNQNELATARQHDSSCLCRDATHPTQVATWPREMGQEPVFSRVHPCCGRGKSARPTLGGQPERVREPLPAGRGRLVAEGKGFCSNFIPLVGWCERFGVWTTFQRQCSRWVCVSHALHTQVRECSRRREYRVSGAIRESAIRAPQLLKG